MVEIMIESVRPEDFCCPNCNKDFGEEELVELMNDPFCGTLIECDCGAEISISIRIVMNWDMMNLNKDK